MCNLGDDLKLNYLISALSGLKSFELKFELKLRLGMIDNPFEFQSDVENKNLIGTGRHCSFCKSEEGLLRPIGNYMVKLEPYQSEGHREKLACQCCRRKMPRAFKREDVPVKKVSRHPKKKKSILSLFFF